MGKVLYLLFSVLTAIIANHLYNGSFWQTVGAFFFAPIYWIIWIINHTVTLSVIRETFSWFFK